MPNGLSSVQEGSSIFVFSTRISASLAAGGHDLQFGKVLEIALGIDSSSSLWLQQSLGECLRVSFDPSFGFVIGEQTPAGVPGGYLPISIAAKLHLHSACVPHIRRSHISDPLPPQIARATCKCQGASSH